MAVDFDDELGRFFILQLDGDEYTYKMRYDAVLLYVDEEDANFYKRHLPDSMPEDPEHEEIVRISRSKLNLNLNHTCAI